MKLTNLLLTTQPETKKVLKKAISANRALANLNGTAKIIPNQNILINALGLAILSRASYRIRYNEKNQ